MKKCKIKVLHVITSLDTGGTEMMLFKLLSGSDRLKIDSIVVSLIPAGRMGKRIEELGVKVESLNIKRKLNVFLSFIILVKKIKKYNPNIVQTWLYHADLMGLMAARIAGKYKTIWNIRCSYMNLKRYRWTTKITRMLCAIFSSLPDIVLTNSKAAQDYHVDMGYKPKRFILIPNGFDTKMFKPNEKSRKIIRKEVGAPEDALCVGFIGRFDPMKDLETFFEAAGLIKKKYDSVHFILSGNSVENKNSIIQKWITKYGIRNKVHLLGLRDDMPNIMASLDVLISSSIGEGFSNVIGEAMASGVPCIVTDVGDSSRIVGEAGLVVAPKDPEGIYRAAHSLFKMGENDRRLLGEQARHRIEKNYALDKVVSIYESLYYDICKK